MAFPIVRIDNADAVRAVSRLTTNKRQEPTRARILSSALPRLQHVEGVRSVSLESRAKSDRHDERTRARLLGSRLISSHFEVQHVHKTAEELAWLADAIVGAFLAQATQGDDEAWQVVDDARLLEVTWLPHDRP